MLDLMTRLDRNAEVQHVDLEHIGITITKVDDNYYEVTTFFMYNGKRVEEFDLENYYAIEDANGDWDEIIERTLPRVMLVDKNFDEIEEERQQLHAEPELEEFDLDEDFLEEEDLLNEKAPNAVEQFGDAGDDPDSWHQD